MSKARDLADSVAAGSVLADGVVSLSEVGGGTNNGVVYVNGTGTTTSGSGLTFDGANLGVAGTVDGRDVAADGSKLDGIEAGATADQTASEIKTAYESNANTNAFTDAEQSKLSGIEAGADVTDTANVTAAGAVMNVEPVRHSIRPSLLLDFANTKTLDPRITFTRPTSATYYDGVTTAKAEENLLVYSEVFGDSNWTKTSVGVSSDATTAPNGSATAELLVPSTSTNGKHIYQQATLESGSAYTLSIFVKAGGYNFVQLTPSNGFPNTTDYVNFNLSTGAIGNTAGTLSPVIQSVGNGWYRVSVTATANTTTGRMLIVPLDSDTASRLPSYAGDGTSGIYLWGAQFEQRSSVTAYTATTSQRITNYIPVLKTAAGGQARFDHDPITGESKGLLIEEQRTNLFLSSGDISDVYWSVSRGTKQGAAAVAPDGSLTATKLVEDTQTGPHHINKTQLSFTSGLSYTLSGFYKAGERTRVRLGLGNNGTPFPDSNSHTALFDLLAGTIVSQDANVTSASITSVGNGWYRCSITATAQATATDTIFLGFMTRSGETVTTYTGDNYSGLFYWGAQLEAGAFPTSYIPTTSAQVTRSADSASMTGTNFSSWYRQYEGTIYGDAISNSAFAGRVFTLDNNTNTASQIQVTTTPSNLAFYIKDSTVVTANFVLGSVSGLSFDFKFATTFKDNDFAGSLNGGNVVTDLSGTLPKNDLTAFQIGRQVNGQYLNGHIRKLAYYPKRLTNAELQGLTS